MNKVILIGNLAQDPELKTTTNGISVATFTVAVNHTYTSANGERGVDFIRCVGFRKQAENIGRYIKKGSKVAVEGKISTRSYEAQDGSKRYMTEVIADSVQFLDSRGSNNEQSSNYNNNSTGYNQNQNNQNQQPAMNSGRNQGGYNNSNSMNTPYGNQNNNTQQKKDDFFDNQANIDISEDDLPF